MEVGEGREIPIISTSSLFSMKSLIVSRTRAAFAVPGGPSNSRTCPRLNPPSRRVLIGGEERKTSLTDSNNVAAD